ncbi:ribbon-helix-helix domain-containing protein [Hydrogenimonas sp. SS33]|uniref:type II toxin-antitoxin system RelB family antitoxin n=1 Tax=Hydrogenimonas leucolamina TaxID=2954236 RepID=UPI00336C0F4E
MLSVRLNEEMEKKLEKLAKSTKRPKSFFVREALENYLDDMIDYYEAMQRKNDPHRELITMEEMEKALGL